MKKIISIILALTLVLGLAACGNSAPSSSSGPDASNNDVPSSPESADPQTPAPTEPENPGDADEPGDPNEEDEPQEGEPTEPDETDAPQVSAPPVVILPGAPSGDTPSEPGDTQTPADPENNVAFDTLTTIWNAYSEDDKFPAMGGDHSDEHITDGAPGRHYVDGADMDNWLAMPAGMAGNISAAASLFHMMNTNTFTAGCFETADADAVIAAQRENIQNRHWICGAPNKLVIFTVNGCVLTAFGADGLIDTFASYVTSAYPSAVLVCDEEISW